MTFERSNGVRFGVVVHGRGLHDWERRSVEELEAYGAVCSFEHQLPAQPGDTSDCSHVLAGLIDRVAGLPQRRSARMRVPEPLRGPRSMAFDAEQSDAAQDKICTVPHGLGGFGRPKFVLLFGQGEVPAGLSDSAELGVWRFTRSSGPVGETPFIYGLRRRDDVVSFGLEQVASGPGYPRPLMSGYFRARGERNRSVSHRILGEATRWPVLALKHWALNGELPDAQPSKCPGGQGVGALRLVMSLLWRDIVLSLSSKLTSYFVLETWRVGLVRMKAADFLAGLPMSGIVLLPRRELGRYIADPFVLSTSPELSLLVEEYSNFGVGRIAKLTVRDPFGLPQVDLEVCLESKHHLSYPFLFREGGVTYCLPECYQSSASRLYRCDAGKLTPVSDIVQNARLTDGTILYHDGLYWLFCGLEDDHDQSNLYLFYSEVLRGTWISHPMNPVKTDVRSARSAGPILMHEGALLRPAQDCSRSYGHGISMNRIQTLTTTSFSETVVTSILPEAVSKSCKGVHTLSFAGEFAVIDAKFHLIGFEPFAVRALRRLKRTYNAFLRASAIPFRSA